MHLLRGVGGQELARQVGEVCEGQFAGVAGVADAQEDDVVVDEVVDRLGGRLDGRLGRGVAGYGAEDLADLGFEGREGGGFGRVVDGGAEHEACGLS